MGHGCGREKGGGGRLLTRGEEEPDRQPLLNFHEKFTRSKKLLMSSYLHGIYYSSTIDNESAYQIVSVCSLFYQPISCPSFHILLSESPFTPSQAP